MFDESPNRDSVLWNSMIGGYLKCALFQAARDLFEIIPNKNVCWRMPRSYSMKLQREIVSWNTMIRALRTHRYCEGAF